MTTSPSFFPHRSGADVTGSKQLRAKEFFVVQGAALEKSKASVTNFFKIDNDMKFQVETRFSNVLYGKFLGWTSLLDVNKPVLLERWRQWGDVSIADHLNGYFLIQCSSQVVMHNMLFEGPWTVNGMVLQLSPWHAFFQLVSTRFSTTTTWI